MAELLVAVGMALVLLLLGALARLSWDAILVLGTWLVAAGLALGVPAGAVYHWLLFKALREAGDVPRGWYWRPLQLHARVPGHRRARVLLWAGAGALGFAITVLGMGVLAVPLWFAWLESGRR